MDKFFYYNNLFSVYRNLLTLKEQNVFSLYYEENLSLSEIAEKYGVNWKTLYNKNKNVIGDNPNLIKPGQILVI